MFKATGVEEGVGKASIRQKGPWKRFKEKGLGIEPDGSAFFTSSLVGSKTELSLFDLNGVARAADEDIVTDTISRINTGIVANGNTTVWAQWSRIINDCI